MKKIPNPEDYEYLWTDYDVNYIFTSCYLFKEFRNADIVLIYDHKEKGLSFFLSKKQRKKFSEDGMTFYKDKFESWKREIRCNISNGLKIIDLTKNDDPEGLTNQEIKDRILERVKLFQDLGSNYFYTEFFFLDLIEKDIENNKDSSFKRKIKDTGQIKFEAREILNSFYNYRIIFKKYLDEISLRTKMKNLEWLSYQEITNFIDGKEIISSNRGKQDWVLTKHNNWMLIDGVIAVNIKKMFDDYFFNNKKKELTGIIANKGHYVGKAKIIKTIFSDNIKKDILKFNKGDILIANTTGPEIMDICQKAGAIVTDEGGITSHAAIISRELKIPCIIGTKIATKVLKDGDYIEVDANKGIVRKLG
jgi:phosphohistidine swiveling domain-containing protein